ncbi:hypothetical protein JYU34_013442 [Plutella xylostella]|uniref:Uncharacterized protein n=1 Tax=Plutella xylostella TaxID=51655 RepID=A0ABQ7Q9S6_PLUXY|nr:hypothetical protein JYU34_013442 [Plutella xylostella]
MYVVIESSISHSVVWVRPRPRPAPAPASALLRRAMADAQKSLLNVLWCGCAPASALLRRAMADAQKSLLNAPLKKDTEIKRGIVLPMRRTIDAKKIVIQIPSDRLPSPDGGHCDHTNLPPHLHSTSPPPRDAQYVPTCISKQFVNTEYVPSRRQSTRVDETLIVETIESTVRHTPGGKPACRSFPACQISDHSRPSFAHPPCRVRRLLPRDARACKIRIPHRVVPAELVNLSRSPGRDFKTRYNPATQLNTCESLPWLRQPGLCPLFYHRKTPLLSLWQRSGQNQLEVQLIIPHVSQPASRCEPSPAPPHTMLMSYSVSVKA